MDLESLPRDEIIRLLKSEQKKVQSQERELRRLRGSEEKYRTLFESSPISLWEEDFSDLKRCIEEKNFSTREELIEYFRNRPEQVVEFASKVRVVDVNSKSVDMYEANSKEDLLHGGLHLVYSEENYRGFIEEIAAIYDGATNFEIEKSFHLPDHPVKYVRLTWAVPENSRSDYSRVLVSIIDITELMNTEAELRREAEENRVLLNEVHHRVKNSLNVVASLLRLQGEEICDEEGARRALEKSRDRVYSMALAHENLYRMGTLSQVYMDEYLSSVITHVAEFYSEGPRVRFEREVDSIRLDITAAVPCGMIVNELVSNALKYAFQGKEEGTIRISFLEENGSYLLSVADDGVGICQELERKDADTLGMWLVEVLAEQLGGRLAVKTEEGTAFTVSFPTKTVRGW